MFPGQVFLSSAGLLSAHLHPQLTLIAPSISLDCKSQGFRGHCNPTLLQPPAKQKMSHKVTPPPSQPASPPFLRESVLPRLGHLISYFPFNFHPSPKVILSILQSLETCSLSYSKRKERSLFLKTSEVEGPQPVSTQASHLDRQKAPKRPRGLTGDLDLRFHLARQLQLCHQPWVSHAHLPALSSHLGNREPSACSQVPRRSTE